jgi:hypothetical protein
MTIVPATFASAATTSHKATVKPDFAYFAGKTITWEVGGAVGSAAWELASVAAPLMASYLHCTINISVTPVSITGQNIAGDSQPNGLTIGEVTPQGDITDDLSSNPIPNVNFSLQTIGLLGAAPSPPSLFVAAPSSGFKTINDLVTSKTPFKDLDNATTMPRDLRTSSQGPYLGRTTSRPRS